MNAHHRGAIAATFRSIDQRLAEVEAILLAVGGQSPLSGYAFDVGPMERQAIAGYLQRIREKMWSAMKHLEVPTNDRRVSAAWAMRTTLMGVMIDLAEIEPRRLAGYGSVDVDAGTTLAGILTDLQRLTNGLEAYVRRSQGENLGDRLARLETSPANREALATIERIITRHGLVELRPMLDLVLSRLESTEFEIAFFGRVSSGKSSLLNYLLGRDVLPVGVLPVTAVLTRLRPADRPELAVRFQISQPQRLPVERIAEFVTEEGNPNNKHRVAEVEVYLPSPRLAQGVAFIDTPGVGSLATFGAAQTKAYLPRCDLGVLLVDAGSSLNHEDLAILQGFYDAAIPAVVLMSKADLLSEPDRNRVTSYIKQQTTDVVGGDMPVFPVSTRGPDAALADTWFNEQIVPFVKHHREHATASIRRKIANLAETAASYLAGMLDRARATRDGEHGPLAREESAHQFDTAKAQQLLASAAERIAAVAVQVTEPIDRGVAERVAQLAASASAALVEQARRGNGPRRGLSEHAVEALAGMAGETRGQIVELSQSLGETVAQLSESFGMPPASEPPSLSRRDPLRPPSLLGRGRGRVGSQPLSIMDEIFGTLSPLPAADEARLRDIPDVRCSRLLALWPRLATWLLRGRIRDRCGAMLYSLFRDHRAKLRTWLSASLERLTNAYEAQAALFRESLRTGGDGQAREGEAPAEPIDELEADLELLRRHGIEFEEQEVFR
jgi:GTP-binding protein EngB required for normal cell division